MAEMFDVLQTQLLEQLVMSKIQRFKGATHDDPIPDHLHALSLNDILQARVARDEIAEGLVEKDHDRDHNNAMDERHVGVEHGVAHGRSQRDHQQELDERKLRYRSASNPADQNERVDVDHDSPNRDL